MSDLTTKKPPPLRVSDLRGLVQLATQATVGVSGIAEGVHQSVWATLGAPGGREPGRARGITGLVYSSVRGAARMVGKGVDTALAGLQPALEPARDVEESPAREAFFAALNGVMGDHLAAVDNPFAIPMTLRYRGESLNWHALPSMPEATGKVLVLIHGLCMNDLQGHARHRGHGVDHGEALASTLGYTPVYLRYNSGLHTSQNGRELAALLERLVAHWPTPVEELAVVAHSMGGLLIRSARHVAAEESLAWPSRLKKIVFLGTPHHGSPLERAGNWVDVVLGALPYTAPFAKLGRVRSAGITDLRHGHVLDEDWQGRDRFRRAPDRRRVVPLPEGVECFAVAATTAAERGLLADRWIGDGLVPLHSALGRHDDARRDLGLAEGSRWIAYRTGHLELLSCPEVTRRMVRWLASESC